MIIVSQAGDGDFWTIQEAVDYAASLPGKNHVVYIKKGVYREKVSIMTPFLSLIGEDAAQTRLVGKYSALEVGENGEKTGTFHTQVMQIEADQIILKNLTIENEAGPGWKVAQALALYADGDGLYLENCRLIGHQDTLFIGPRLARVEREGALCRVQRALFFHCYMEGDVDFIFGCGCAYFDQCIFFSRYSPCPQGETDRSQKKEDRDRSIAGYVTAAATPRGQRYGFVMNDCRFEGDCPEKSVFLGRPWRNYARVALLHCYLGAHIGGWHDWGKKEARKTVSFVTYQCRGPGASHTQEWVRELRAEEAAAYAREIVLGVDSEKILFVK